MQGFVCVCVCVCFVSVLHAGCVLLAPTFMKVIYELPVGFNGQLDQLYQLLLACIYWQTQLVTLIK